MTKSYFFVTHFAHPNYCLNSDPSLDRRRPIFVRHVRSEEDPFFVSFPRLVMPPHCTYVSAAFCPSFTFDIANGPFRELRPLPPLILWLPSKVARRKRARGSSELTEKRWERVVHKRKPSSVLRGPRWKSDIPGEPCVFPWPLLLPAWPWFVPPPRPPVCWSGFRRDTTRWRPRRRPPTSPSG